MLFSDFVFWLIGLQALDSLPCVSFFHFEFQVGYELCFLQRPAWGEQSRGGGLAQHAVDNCIGGEVLKKCDERFDVFLAFEYADFS